MRFEQLLAEPSSAALNLQRLITFRHLILLGQIAAVLVAVYIDLQLPFAVMLGVFAIIAGYGVMNFVTWLRLRRWARPVTERELFQHLLGDVAVFTGLLYFTGGPTNPFVFLFLLPLTLAAAALSWSYTWVMAAITVLCYSVLMLWYVPLPHRHGENFNLHVLGMWFGFVLSAVLIAYFAVKMSATLRERERVVADAREQALRDERLVALGTLAAGAAHELGTPLATMAVLSKDLENDLAAEPAAAQQLRVLRGQIDRCKHILSSLAVSAGQSQALGGRSQALDHYLAQVIAQWRELRPHAVLRQRWEGQRPAPHVVADLTLTQAITAILNNAADASAHNIECHGRWDDSQLSIEICDRGSGMSKIVESHLGEPFFTTKRDGEGMGLGLFLAQATMQRLGGSLHLLNRAGGGACTRIVLPLAGLLVQR